MGGIDKRQPASILIVGAQASGKTTLALKIIKESNRKTLVVDSDGYEEKLHQFPVVNVNQLYKLHRTKAKVRVIFDEDDPQFFRKIRDQFLFGQIVFDDAAFFLSDHRAHQFKRILMKNRQTNNDVIWICHGLSDVPPAFWSYFQYLILFRTIDSFERKKHSYPGFEEMKNRVVEVNKMAEENQYANKIYQLR